jgi:hypothetical protein
LLHANHISHSHANQYGSHHQARDKYQHVSFAKFVHWRSDHSFWFARTDGKTPAFTIGLVRAPGMRSTARASECNSGGPVHMPGRRERVDHILSVRGRPPGRPGALSGSGRGRWTPGRPGLGGRASGRPGCRHPCQPEGPPQPWPRRQLKPHRYQPAPRHPRMYQQYRWPLQRNWTVSARRR